MSVPWQQSVAVLRHVFRNRWKGNRRYALVLMLEPLMRCNLACVGCGKIQHPAEILRRNVTPEQCFQAVEECEAPVVAIPGGEPLLHPQIDTIVEGLVSRKKYVYLCTNAIKLKESLHKFKPSRFLAFSVHMDGMQATHDASVNRQGVFEIAIEAIQAARAKGFRVTTNTTIFNHSSLDDLAALFDRLMGLGVEGMMIAPGYAYSKAPDQQGFLGREHSHSLFDQVLGDPRARRWKFNQSPLYLEFLRGRYSLDCTAWGSPAYNVFGWQKPCYLMDEGYVASYKELLDTTDWSKYGHASGNAKCANCLMHCGFEPTAVEATLGSVGGFWATIKSVLGPRSPARPVVEPATPVSLEPSLPFVALRDLR